MRLEFPIIASMLALLCGVTSAQVQPCGTMLPLPVSDNRTRSCEIMKNSGAVCHKVMLVVTGFPNVSGYGASVASSNSNNVKNLEFVECHIMTRKGMPTLTCRERYNVAKNKMTGERFQMDLGLLKSLDSVMIAISRRMVHVTVNKHTLMAYIPKKQKGNSKSEKVTYILQAVFPLREASAFCSENNIHYKANGAVVKIKDRVNKKLKKGAGYIVAAYKLLS